MIASLKPTTTGQKSRKDGGRIVGGVKFTAQEDGVLNGALGGRKRRPRVAPAEMALNADIYSFLAATSSLIFPSLLFSGPWFLVVNTQCGTAALLPSDPYCRRGSRITAVPMEPRSTLWIFLSYALKLSSLTFFFVCVALSIVSSRWLAYLLYFVSPCDEPPRAPRAIKTNSMPLERHVTFGKCAERRVIT